MNQSHIHNISISYFKALHAPFIFIPEHKKNIFVFFQGARLNEKQQIWMASYKKSELLDIKCISNDLFHKWFNPVVQVVNDQLWVFIKRGDAPYNWKGFVSISNDLNSWSKPNALPNDLLGPTKNAPIWLDDNYLLMPSSNERGPGRIYLEKLNIKTGESQSVSVSKEEQSITQHFLQPALIRYPSGVIHGYCRSNQSRLYHFKSFDNGVSFSDLEETDIANPNSAFFLIPAPQKNGYYMALNPTECGRKKLCIVFVNWEGEKRVIYEAPNLDNDDLAYPSIALIEENKLLLCYSVNQTKLKVSVVNI